MKNLKKPNPLPKPAKKMDDNPLHEVFLDELADTLSAERRLVKAIPKMIKAAKAPELRAALEEHWAETQDHVARIEKAFKSVGAKPRSKLRARRLRCGRSDDVARGASCQRRVRHRLFPFAFRSSSRRRPLAGNPSYRGMGRDYRRSCRSRPCQSCCPSEDRRRSELCFSYPR